MAKGIITSFRVEAATNGYTLSYCIKTKMPATAGQTYANTDYKDVSTVFEEGNEAGLMDAIKKLLPKIEDGANEEAGTDDEDDYPVLMKD